MEVTELLVIGTIHGFHFTIRGYSNTVLMRLLDKADPAAVCLEIRPSDAEAGQPRCPQEMQAVGIAWATRRGRPWYPMDWWPDNGHELRREFMKNLTATDGGRERLERLRKEDKLPEFAVRWNACSQVDYRQFNSGQVAQEARRVHDLERDLLGDGPGNLWWEKRNLEMCRLTAEAAAKHGGQRVAVLTGWEHKYWFDDYFSSQPGIRLLQLDDLGDIDLDDSRSPATDKERSTAAYRFLESPFANDHPDLLHLGGLLGEINDLLSRTPGDPGLLYTKGMYFYVVRDYRKGLEFFREAAANRGYTLDMGGSPLPFWVLAYLRTGMMYDLLGERDQAVACYERLRAEMPEGVRFGQMAERLVKSPFARPVG